MDEYMASSGFRSGSALEDWNCSQAEQSVVEQSLRWVQKLEFAD